ncbi:MAG: hypothetical protein CMH60_00715 [Myxococcales bacterium]|nr:hypothetical protein [Myxococcales bacterium]
MAATQIALDKGKSSAREAVLEAAVRLFAQQGFAKTSLKAIAQEVDIRTPSLLYHFPSKQVLETAAIESLNNSWKNILPQILSEAKNPDERFDRTLEVCIAFFQEEPTRAKLFLRALLDKPDELKEIIKRDLQPWLKLISKYIQRGQEEEIIHQDLNPEAYTMSVVILVLSTFALGQVRSAFIDSSNAETLAKDELIRFARTALFRPTKMENNHG